MDAPTILVVEDDAAVRQGVVDALTFAGYEVLSEADGKSRTYSGLMMKEVARNTKNVQYSCSKYDKDGC